MNAYARFSATLARMIAVEQLATLVFVALLVTGWALPASAVDRSGSDSEMAVRLPGHVLGALQHATVVASVAGTDAEPLTLTITLKRSDQAGFERYLHDVYDPHSPSFRRFLDQFEIATRFGPTQQAYEAVLAYLERNGFLLIDGAPNRLTVTVRGTRGQAQRAFGVAIRDYRIGDEVFFANDEDPALPSHIAPDVQAITGLADFAKVRHSFDFIPDVKRNRKKTWLHCVADRASYPNVTRAQAIKDCGDPPYPSLVATAESGSEEPPTDPPPTNWLNVNGTGQTIGLLEFDSFHISDMSDYLTFWGFPPALIGQITQVPVNGGAAVGAWETEVLLDIVAAITDAPGANVAVYSGPFGGIGTSFQAMFNRMVSDGVAIISNSWYYCENQTTAADAQSIDAILAGAAASGVSVFNAAGDNGNSCNGSPNVVAVPADSPHATAVGGTSLTVGPAGIYGGEKWWDGSQDTPPSGQGGFGVSQFFGRPSYQTGLTASPTRSIPDVAINGDPNAGFLLCQADAGGCPTGALYAGTSGGAPIWAAFAALLNQARGQNIGNINAALYPLANTPAFHSAASMGTDFAHVGLGSPNLNVLHRMLVGQAVGGVNGDVSQLKIDCPQSQSACGIVSADGVSKVQVVALLRDANGNLVSGKTTVLMPSAGAHAAISPGTGISNADNGAVVFEVTDTTIEDVTLTAVDLTDGVPLTQTYTVSFVSPPATAASISASPNSVAANGTSATTITVTLQDAKGNPTPGKVVTISQGGGRSVLAASNPAVTNANGQIQFTATDLVAETVTYTAIDVTDDHLPVPGSAQVSFTGAGASCVSGTVAAAPGFTLTPFANGFASANLSYSNVNWGCQGAYNPTFDANGNVFVNDFINGNVYKLPQTGGAATSANILSNVGLTVERPVFGKDGSMYVARGATGAGFNSGVVLKIDPSTGATLATLASGLTCPSTLLVDPISGDLFFGDTCFGAGADNASIWRISNPASATPTMSVYATLPATPTVGFPGFAPDGTLYVAYGQPLATAAIARIAGTNSASPGTLTTLPAITTSTGVSVVQAQPNGAAKALLVTSGTNLLLVDITTAPFTTTVLATGTLNQNGQVLLSPGTVGPDGCLYFSSPDTVFRLTPASGACGFVPTNPAPALALSPSTVSPNPAQGTTVTFTATLANVSQPQGTPIVFSVGGANSVAKMVRADSNGQAAFTYTGVFTGSDMVEATATVGVQTVVSNTGQLTWTAGKHATFLTLNASPNGGKVGQPFTARASLTDMSTTPPVGVVNANVLFTMGASSCSAVSDANGNASCTLVPTSPGILSLSATFQGTDQYVASTARVGFTTLTSGAVVVKCDANGDGKVDATDLAILRRSFGAASGPDDPRDTNGDGVINIVDLRYCQLHQTSP